MPSSPGYARDYKQEYKVEDTQRRKQRAMRNAAHRGFEKVLGHAVPKGMDVHHKKDLSKGGSNSPDNLKMEALSDNRSYPRTKTGAIRGK